MSFSCLAPRDMCYFSQRKNKPGSKKNKMVFQHPSNWCKLISSMQFYMNLPKKLWIMGNHHVHKATKFREDLIIFVNLVPKILCLKKPSHQNSGFSPLEFRKHGARRVWHLFWENPNFSWMVAGIRKLFWVTSKGIFRLCPAQIWKLSSQQFWNWEPLKNARI
mgnify:CR=1 FL=1